MKTTINFDMDGTIANLYGVENWLDYLIANDTTPYAIAEPMLRMSALAKRLNNLQKRGYRISVISWLSKSGTPEYNEAVTATKKEWLAKHLASVHFDEITIVPYGTPKENFLHTPNDILFDDEEKNRNNWTGKAFPENEIMTVLASL